MPCREYILVLLMINYFHFFKGVKDENSTENSKHRKGNNA